MCVCVWGDFYRSMLYLEIFLLTLGKCIFNFLSDVQMVPNLWWFDFMIFQLYDGVRAVWIKQKAYIEFWILIFSWTSDRRYDTLWGWAAAVSTAPSQPSHPIARVNNQYSTLRCVACVFWLLRLVFSHSVMSTKWLSLSPASGENLKTIVHV